MHKNKTRNLVISLMLGLMLCVSFFAGCNLVTRNMARYYNTIVASATYDDGSKVEVTKRELITAFNNYGYQYYTNYGMALSEAYKLTLDRVLDLKLTVHESERLARLKEGHNNEILTAQEKTYLWEETLNAAKQNIKSYYGSSSDDQTDSTSDLTQNVYKPSAQLVTRNQVVNGKEEKVYAVKLTETIKTALQDHDFWSEEDRDAEKDADLDVMYDELNRFISQNPDYNRSYSRYLADARQSESGMNLSTDAKSVFKREFKRIYKSLYENYMVEQYEQDNQELEYSPVTINNILKLYENKVRKDYTKYVTEGATSYDTDILSTTTISNMNYFVENSSTQYFYVSHILAKFTDEQQAIYDECQKVLKNESSRYEISDAKKMIEGLYSQLVFPVREKVVAEDGTITWKDTGTTKPVDAVMAELKTKLASAGSNEYLKAEYFDEFIYKYNQDEGIQNSDRNYVIGVDYSTPDENGNPTAHSSMVEPFTNAAISLYNHGAAQIGDLYDGYIKTDYGIHIMLFEGKVQNLFTGIDENFSLNTDAIKILASKEARLKAGESKTVFDALFDELNKSNYSTFESMNMEALRSQVKIKYYVSEYKDLINS